MIQEIILTLQTDQCNIYKEMINIIEAIMPTKECECCAAMYIIVDKEMR